MAVLFPHFTLFFDYAKSLYNMATPTSLHPVFNGESKNMNMHG